ncbi:MAG: hypothetical protein NC038_06900 [Paludibacter sp.]|nr:hypothetical protein [Bacteroidales bacterium]MCM1069629.1 hypothetical protein [Prevotella sp.]MCM1354275.1 hypothetical protein [Bacteroides sp.]MCM1443114.1 hypothetical protein [Muribaculum sp.]MCM1482349.1 hypothetical protein [Paludibacter sp.]
MKKFTLFAVSALIALSANAHTLNNPIGADGRYIVRYDCANNCFSSSNNMEADETFVFAIDVTGTWMEEWLKQPATAEGASRGLAINKWTSKGDANGNTNRLKQIDGNIYGMTVNYYQIMIAEQKSDVVMKDSVLYVYGQIFGFEYTAENPGANWWMWEYQEGETTQANGADCLFATVPYTGTRTSPEFYGSDYDEDIFGFDELGYAAPCVQQETAVENVMNNNADVIAVEYYNVLGTKLAEMPAYGIYVKTSILSNGKRVSEKVILTK